VMMFRNALTSIEFRLLNDFNTFIRERRDKYWVHWNMRNLAYGFEHLEHRYKALGGRDSAVIPVERRVNLNDMLAHRYGAGYAKHPKLKSLMDINGGIHRYFLTGPEEVLAFEQNEFIKMHNSTLCKVGFFFKVIRRVLAGRLIVSSRGFGVAIDRLFESRTAKIVGLVSSILTVLSALSALGIWAVHFYKK